MQIVLIFWLNSFLQWIVELDQQFFLIINQKLTNPFFDVVMPFLRQYKEIFYKTLLPDLRERGKLVIVITHDDRYFHLGDQIIKLEDGKVVEYVKTGVEGRRS